MFDPRSKLLFTLAWSMLVILSTRGESLLLASLLTWGGVVVLKQTHWWFKTLRFLVPMTLFFVLVMLWAFDIETAVIGALRVLTLTTTFFLFFRTTTPEDLANALVASGAPYTFAFIVTTAMQFIPVLARKMNEVFDAQRARGLLLEGNLARVRYYPALVVPLLVQTFTLADHLAEAMEARGFGAARRTFARPYVLRWSDAVLIGAALGVLIIGWWWR
jgi:energy-coupling factor transport system permease protein